MEVDNIEVVWTAPLGAEEASEVLEILAELAIIVAERAGGGEADEKGAQRRHLQPGEH